MSKLKIYKASAGSGKTHSLTEEYLKLASQITDNFKRILAVTFTNKAAEEMKQRILESLNEVIIQGNKSDFYSLFVEDAKKTDEFTIIEKARFIRDSILHNYSFFSLSTIDSFVQKVIKSFTYEIGVESGYRVELDSDKVISDLTDILYRQIDDDIDLRNYLIHFANYKLQDGKNWDFKTEINKLAREIFKEEFHVSDKQTDDRNDLTYILDYFDKLTTIKQSFENKMKGYAKKASLIFTQTGSDHSIIGRNIVYLNNYLVNKIANPEKEEDFIPGKTVAGLLDDLDKWSNKTANPEIRAIANQYYNVLNPILKQVLALIGSRYKYYLGAVNILSSFHAFGILRKLAALLPDYRNLNNLLLISDTTKILKEIVDGNDAPFIYEKIGNRYQHLLIDEFQDTSGFQWGNFKPLIQNSLAEGNQNLIVGDIKQSIYRWRGGDWSLLLSRVEQEIGTQYVQHENLKVNWRSKKNIVDFNNSFFKKASDLLQSLFNSEISEVTANLDEQFGAEDFSTIISKAYSDTFQNLPNKPEKKGGRVKMSFFKFEKGTVKKDWMDYVAKELPLTIDLLLKNKNYHPGDIAILVRRNEEGKTIANLLLDYQLVNKESSKYQIISSDSLLVSNSPVIQILTNAMYYIHDSEDKIHLHALIAVFNSTLYADREINDKHFNSPVSYGFSDLLPQNFHDNLESYKRANIYELTEKLCEVFSLNQVEGQSAYIQTFKDIVADFGLNEATDLGAFMQWWEKKGKLISVQLSDQPDALKILSIHKSKGLAFKVVIVPYCDWALKPSSQQDTIIWTESEIPPFNYFKRFPVLFRKYLVNSIFKREYCNELLYSMIDALNMLYVAFTRPREELIIMAPARTIKDGKFNSVADLLCESVQNEIKEPNLIDLHNYYVSEFGIFEIHSDYIDIDGDKFSKEISQKPDFKIEDYPLSDWNQKINIINHAEDFFMKSIAYIESKVNYGTLMHQIFSKIRYSDEISKLTDELYYAGKINSEEKKLLIDKLEEMVNRPIVSEWFSKDWKVRTEDAILDISGKIRIPDRVLFKPDKTVIIDFKFGEYHQESIQQVKEYMNLLKQMNYPNIHGFVYYAEKNLVEEIF
jgi:ATP-dependent exoDNAse (exonuclease V) beta subunit